VTVKVIDASAVVALLFKEPAGEQIPAQLRGCDLHAPDLLPYEVANACLKKIRAKPDEREALLTAFELFSNFSFTLVTVDTVETITLAADTRLSLYDASYLWLARRLGCGLLTLDDKLLKVAGKS
jgi:predicted nucleic acid-binding protein